MTPTKQQKLESIEARVKEVIIDQLACTCEDATPNANLHDDLGADSLDAVELVMCLEEEFNLTIPDEDGMEIQTVKQAVEYVQKHARL